MSIDFTCGFSENDGISGKIFLRWDLWVVEYG